MDGGREILLNTSRGHHHVARLVIRSVEAAGTLAPVGKESVSKPEMFSKVKVTSNSLTTSAGLLSLLRQQSVSLDGFRNGFTRCKLGRKEDHRPSLRNSADECEGKRGDGGKPGGAKINTFVLFRRAQRMTLGLEDMIRAAIKLTAISWMW